MKTLAYFMLFAIPAMLAWGEPASDEVPDLRTYPLGFADGPSTVEVVNDFMAKAVKVYYDPATRQLLVLATSNQHVRVAELVKQLNVPPRNVQITVHFKNKETTSDQEASLRGSGRVVMGNQGPQTSIRIRPRLEDSRMDVDSSTRQQLLVSSGKQASLFIGEQVPYIEWLMDYGCRHRIIEQKVAWQQVGAYLVIAPVIIGNGPTIQVRLTPELSGLVDGNPYRTRFSTVTTDVIATDGVPFSLGGLAEKNEFFSRFLIGVKRGGIQQTLDIEMTAVIQPVGR